MTIAVDFDGTIVENRYPEIGDERMFATEIHFCHNCNLIFVRLAYCGAAGYTCPYGCELYSYPKRACLIRPPPIQEGGSGFILIF